MPSKPEILSESLKSAVKETSVPALMLLKVIKNYHDAISAHKRDMTTNQAILRASKKDREEHQRHIKEHDAQIGAYNAELERSRTIAKGDPGEPGAPGLPGADGQDADEQRIIESILSRIPLPKDGDPGAPGKDAVIDEKAFMNRLLGRIKNEQLLDLSHIKGAQGFIKDGVNYKFEELMHGGSGTGSTINFVNNEIISGSGTSWTLANTPVVGSVQLYGNGQYLTPGVGNDYQIVASAITTTNSFSSGTIVANYRK